MPHKRHENAGLVFPGDSEPAKPEPNSRWDYRARAIRLRALAAESLNPEIRAYLLTTAAQFDRLADYAAGSARVTHAA